MITKELIKAEVDRVQDEYLEALYKIIHALTETNPSGIETNAEDLDWRSFIQETYGCLTDAPLERGDQGGYEIREIIE